MLRSKHAPVLPTWTCLYVELSSQMRA